MQMTFLRGWAPHILSILRILAAATFLTHGTMKLFGWPAPFPYPLNGLTYTAAILEVVGGLLLIVGLFSRPVAFVLSGRDGRRLFHGTCLARFLPRAQRRRGRDALLLHLSLHRSRRPWAVERRRGSRQGLAGKVIGHPASDPRRPALRVCGGRPRRRLPADARRLCRLSGLRQRLALTNRFH